MLSEVETPFHLRGLLWLIGHCLHLKRPFDFVTIFQIVTSLRVTVVCKLVFPLPPHFPLFKKILSLA